MSGTRHFNLQKGYECPECGADVEAAGGPDGMSCWRCRSCDWSEVYDPAADEFPSEDLDRRPRSVGSDADWADDDLRTDGGGQHGSGPSRWSNPLSEPNGRVGPGAVLYDVRDPDRRPCCREGGRCLAHVVGVYEETATSEVYFRVQDGTHTTEHWCHQGDLLALYEPAGWSVPTRMKPTYALTRRHGVEDHHDTMAGGRQSTKKV